MVTRGLPRPLLDKSAGVVIWLYPLEAGCQGDPDTEEARSGDGPLSVRSRPSTVKDSLREVSSQKKPPPASLTAEPLRPLRPEDKGEATACPDRTRAIPCTVQAVTDRGVLLVHGACPRGADAIAATYAAWTPGYRTEAHLAHWRQYGRAAGYRRNAEMIALGADGCAAFIRDRSPGSTSAVRLATAAGIPVWLHTQLTRQSLWQSGPVRRPVRPVRRGW